MKRAKPQTKRSEYTPEQLEKLNAGLELVGSVFDWVDPDLGALPRLGDKCHDIKLTLEAFRKALSLLRCNSLSNGKHLSKYKTSRANNRANRLELLAAQVGEIAYCDIEIDDDHCEDRALSPDGKQLLEDLTRIESELVEAATRCRTVDINEAKL